MGTPGFGRRRLIVALLCASAACGGVDVSTNSPSRPAGVPGDPDPGGGDPSGPSGPGGDSAVGDPSVGDSHGGDPGSCSATCSDRCGGADDGCGGSCDAPCAGDARLLRTQGATLVDGDGVAVPFAGAISCCGGGYGWPLFDESWVDLVEPHGVNFLHMRLGPFLTGPGGESDWAGIGGGYLESGGKADLSQFNPLFWARVRELIAYAAARGMWVEVDVIDGWGIKHCRWGDIPGYSAWSPDNNQQGEDWCDDAGSREIIGGDVHEAWVRRLVHETGRFANVIYQDGNEVGLIPGYVPEWTLSIRNIIHDQETRDGYGRHLFGTNSGDPTTMQAEGVDFIELHQDDAANPAECFGRPCLVNEYNPHPSLSAAAFRARFCAAQANGTYFWYWRHGQSASVMAASLAAMGEGC